MIEEMPQEQGDVAEVARNILERLLDLMGIMASVSPSAEFPAEFLSDGSDEPAGCVTLDVTGEDLGILIGRRGQTLASLQYMVRLIVGNRAQPGLPIIIDVEGYKRRRCESLRAMACRIAEQVKTRNAPFTLEPMPAFERRVIHLTLANDPDVTTESTGLGEARKVVILPRSQ